MNSWICSCTSVGGHQSQRHTLSEEGCSLSSGCALCWCSGSSFRIRPTNIGRMRNGRLKAQHQEEEAKLTMMGSSKVQDALAAKEQARIRHKQMVDAERLIRLGNYNPNKVNVDVSYLNQQVAEKQKQEADERDYDNLMREHSETIERELQDADADEHMYRELNRQEVMRSWKDACQMKKENEEREKRVKDFDEDVAGPSAMLHFDGETANFHVEDRRKKNQMKDWVAEQLKEKADLKAASDYEETQYAEMLKIVDEIREGAEIEEKQVRQYVTNTIKDQNLELAAEVKYKNDKERAEAKKGGRIIKGLIEEDKVSAINEYGRVYRRDMFKGFTVAQQKRMLSENDDMVRMKQDMDTMISNQDYEWSLQQDLQLKAMEACEYEEELLRSSQLNQYTANLKLQKDEKLKKAADFKKSHFSGETTGSLLDSMGRSAR